MKMLSRSFLAVLLVGLPTVGAYRRRGLRSHGQRGSAQGADANVDTAGTEAGLQATLGSMVAQMMEGKGPGMRDIVKTVHGKMDFGTAVQQLDGKLPDDIASLVRLTAKQGGASGSFDEASLQKARKILNSMMFQAWAELDDVVFECKEFQDRNRGTYEQVVADLARVGSQLAKYGELRVSASEGIAEQDRQRKEAEEVLSRRTQLFKSTRFENAQEMTIRKNDLAVFDFVLNLTACSNNPTSAFLQLGTETVARPHVQICSTRDGPELNFDDAKLQAKVERMMTPEARQALREALGQATAQMSFMQVASGTELPPSSTTSTALPTYAAEVVPVVEAPHPAGQWKKCVDGTPNCGLLHDLMSLEWGKFRDSFDELTQEMKSNQDEFDTLKRNINDELTVINDEKTKHMETLAATISSINAATEEMNEKDEQKRELVEEFDKTCAIFRAKITEIMFTRICAVRKVRNELLTSSTITPPSNISDCDFTDWASKTGECFAPGGQAILCDDTCPQADPYKCGGLETLKRDIVVSPDANGMACPPMERQKRCGQKKCEVNCVMSSWSGYSKCTKECESGVQSKTRSILVKPKNGGAGCDAVQEERVCNTGSCDRDCTLKPWSDWAPCSMACGGGITTRKREVLVPIRGQGKCPRSQSRKRFNEKTCNTAPCVGDEICIAQQDLVITLDASGSLRQSGFEVLRAFAANLTDRYQSEYFGLRAMQIGLVLFGNGQLMTAPDGSTTISPAINVQPLTTDISLVRTKIEETTWQRGFTNMAQALTLADVMLSQGGRSEAQSAILVLSDGKYSFKYQTQEKARELKDKNVQLFMSPVADFEGKELDSLRDWASQPWETNFERIPGLDALKYNAAIFVEKLLVKFCPDSLSPSQLLAIENQRQYMLIHENGWPSDSCGKWYWIGKVGSKDDCAAKARERNLLAFAYGKSFAVGRCYAEAITVTQADFDTWRGNRRAPPCPNGSWLFNPFFDTYAINPSTV